MATGAASVQRQAVPVRHRPNIDEMTAPQIEALRDAFEDMQKIGDDRGYGYYAGLHGLPLPKECRIAHGWPAFLPWHRAYLYEFEQALRDNGRHDVMLPWWDWTKTREVPAAYAEKTRPDGSPNPLFSASISSQALAQGKRASPAEEKGWEWTRELAEVPETVRQPGLLGAAIPTPREIDAVMKKPDYESFRLKIEDYHGDVHVWVGGHMSNLPFAAFDPLFWAHHCMIDRLWREWQMDKSDATFPAVVRTQVMEPFNWTAGAVLDPTALGYDYALSIGQVRP
jgi:tyrosinase